MELAKRAGGGGHGLVNAVLRRATREGRALLDASATPTPAAAALLHSHPEWIAELWWEQLGPEQARALMERDNEAAESAVRANTLRATAAELIAVARARGRRRDASATLVPEARRARAARTTCTARRCSSGAR